MNKNNQLLLSLFILMILSVSCQKPQVEFDENLDLSGGWNYEIYHTKTEEFANTLLKKAQDNYGDKKTPMLLSLIDLKTRQKIAHDVPNSERDLEKKDYAVNRNGSNLFHDFPALRGLYHLSNVTRKSKYRDAANDYLKYFLANCVSPATGLFAYGDYMYYDVAQDTIEGYWHTLGFPIPLLTEMWKLAPEEMRHYTEAILEYHIYDKETFFYDQQANYYSGEIAQPTIRTSGIKHAGLFSNIFLAAYSQTEDRNYLNWSHQIAKLLKEQTNPKTGLVRDNLLDSTASTCRQNPLLSWYLLNTTRFLDDDILIGTAMTFIRAFSEYAYNPADQTFFAELQITDGQPVSEERQVIWEDYGPAIIAARACILAFNQSQEKFFLDRALKYATFIRNNAPTRTTPPGNMGHAIQFFLDMYETNKSSVFLNEARKMAQYAIKTYFEKGLIKSSPDGSVYSAKTGPGELFAALVRLYEIEANLDFHWKAPKVVKKGTKSIPFVIKMKTPTALLMDYAFGTDSVRTLELTSSKRMAISFEVPVDDPNFDGIFYFYFYNPDKSLMSESGQIIIDDDLAGPEIRDVNFEPLNSVVTDVVIRAQISDPKGVKNVILKYECGKFTNSIAPESSCDTEYVFRISPPAVDGVDSLVFFIEAEDNDNIPAKSISPQYFLRWEDEIIAEPQAQTELSNLTD